MPQGWPECPFGYPWGWKKGDPEPDDSRPALTIGIPVYDDSRGLKFTLQSLRMHHDLSRCELLVVDNRPDSKHGESQRGLCAAAGARYIPFVEVTGPANAKDRVFREARGKAVLCLDSHVLIASGAIAKLIDFYEAGKDEGNLLQGPVLMDDLKSIATHFSDEWSGGTWGTWQTNREDYDKGEPFEIPAQGCGLLSCRKSAWLGFNPRMKGYGGEEHVLHRRFRRAGKKCLCLPWLAWWHEFGRVEGVPYPLPATAHCLNYIVNFVDLRLDLAPLRKAYVDRGTVSAEWFDEMVETEQREQGYFPVAALTEPERRELGDLVHEGIKFLHLDVLMNRLRGLPDDSQCSGCERRRRLLNRASAYLRRPK